jgi:hypothetical protein
MATAETWSPLPDDFPVLDPFADDVTCDGCFRQVPGDDAAEADCGDTVCGDCAFHHLTCCGPCIAAARDTEDLR